MKKIKLTGKVVISFTQVLEVPDDEVDDLVCSKEDLQTNFYLDRSLWEIYDFDEFNHEIMQ